VKVTEKRGKITREYSIVGPRRDTVDSFWRSLVDAEVIDSYNIEEEE
jgi:hypothetical protein